MEMLAPSRPLIPSLPSWPLGPVIPMEPSAPLITTEEPSLPVAPTEPSLPFAPSLPATMLSDRANSTLAPLASDVCFTVRFLPATISTVFWSEMLTALAS